MVAGAVAAAAVVLTLSLGAAPAFAGPGDHGNYPGSSCTSNSSIITTRAIENELGQVVGSAQLWYSWNCETNWIQVPGNAAGGNTVKDIRVSGGTWMPQEIDYGNVMSFTRMVYAPGTTCVDFQVHLYYPNGHSYGETYDAFANYQTAC